MPRRHRRQPDPDGRAAGDIEDLAADLRRKGCEGKLRHDTADDAQGFAGGPIDRKAVYRCGFCGYWHVGGSVGDSA